MFRTPSTLSLIHFKLVRNTILSLHIRSHARIIHRIQLFQLINRKEGIALKITNNFCEIHFTQKWRMHRIVVYTTAANDPNVLEIL